ncbi:uncharacterized protein LOC135845237 [Planococcus citri]|uniref:uncharacterized protein LOC135845237 n=1 Tax=Planococcus citri TaxID=170843 RepID=UPI0031FA3AE2
MTNSEDEEVTLTYDQCKRNKRILKKNINANQAEALAKLNEQPSFDLVHQISAILDIWSKQLRKVEIIDQNMLDLLDSKTFKDEASLEKAEDEIVQFYHQSLKKFSEAKGTLNAMAARLNKAEQAAQQMTKTRKSMDTSFVGENLLGNPLAKLPDIKVPKFDGDITGFTEWHSMYVALVHSNDMLQPVHKLYFLKGALIKDAEYLLKDTPVKEGMYDLAYEAVLTEDFNIRAIIAAHFAKLLDMPAITPSSLRDSISKIRATIRGLQTCDIDVAKMSPLITFITVRKLPEKLRIDWENSNLDYSTYPSFDSLDKFLSARCFAYETANLMSSTSKATPEKANGSPKKPKSALAASGSPKTPPQTTQRTPVTVPKCIDCGETHYLSQCTSFQSKSVADREAFVISKKLCKNCLRPGHLCSVCRSSKCRKCEKNHHTLLHIDTTNQSGGSDPDPKSSLLAIRNSKNVLLPTAVVKVRKGRRFVLARALLDSGSQVNLVTEAFAKQLRLSKTPSDYSICGISSSKIQTNYIVSFDVHSRYKPTKISLEAQVIGSLPYSVEPQLQKHVATLDSTLNLADSDLNS